MYPSNYESSLFTRRKNGKERKMFDFRFALNGLVYIASVVNTCKQNLELL